MKKYFLTFVMVAVAGIFSAAAQGVIGKWKTIDDETGEAKSIVEIYEQNGKIYGKVVEILNPAKKNAKCTKCEGSDKDKPILGLVIIRGLEKDGDEYTDGDILDPNKGKLYSCTIKLEGKDKLNVRGYLGFSLLGRSQTWTRV
ncbi:MULTISPECIES: DUF2147 domain-containing protein [Flavobacterium]|uniref:DUF2147 domain-containing protein n=1 Tax=Flavobacterium TaxID=237 RepID=UPI000C47F377|nr:MULTISPECIES: DUF2147 domain-containing protein [Flavobacterium]MBE99574.1 hypothetical protein [Flavobacterium sp.]MBY8961226.1 DUF2147 domain-containing protein [Flavobacterium coralii]|tara:strand:- start:101 stop:529 length:429 start_codon:yes stop_codon:yes gene_type:complete